MIYLLLAARVNRDRLEAERRLSAGTSHQCGVTIAGIVPMMTKNMALGSNLSLLITLAIRSAILKIIVKATVRITLINLSGIR